MLARVLAFWLALTPALAFGQSILNGFPPGSFQSRAAIDASSAVGPTVTPVLSLGGGVTSPSTSAATWGPLIAGNTQANQWSVVSFRAHGIPFPIPGTLSKLSVSLPALTTNTWSVALYQNSNNATILTCSVTGPATTCSDNTDSVSIAAGDIIGWAMCPGTFVANVCSVGSTPTSLSGIQISAVFTGTNNNETFLLADSSANASNSVANFGGLNGQGLWGTTEINVSILIPAAGTVDHLFANAFSTPGAGSWTMTLCHNGTCTGSLPTCNITSTSNCSDLTDTIAVSAGDTISIQSTPNTTPSAAPLHASARFVPSVPGQSILATTFLALSGTAAFLNAMGQSATGATESPLFSMAPSISGGFTIKNLYFCMSADPGAAKVRTFVLRDGGSSSSVTGTLTGGASQTVPCGGSSQPGFSGSASLTGIAASTTLDYEETNTSGPTAITWGKISAVMTVP